MNENLPDVSELEKEYKKLVKKGASEEELSKLENDISKGHNYVFIGNVGQFTPVKSGSGGGVLVCKRGDKYVNVTGSTGYRWLESEIARENGGMDIVDTQYYRVLCDDAIDTINSVGTYPGADNFDIFVNGSVSECRGISSNLPF
jgi:hypothetical protein